MLYAEKNNPPLPSRYVLNVLICHRHPLRSALISPPARLLSTLFPYCASRSFPSPTCHFTPLLSHTLFHLPAMPLNGRRNPTLFFQPLPAPAARLWPSSASPRETFYSFLHTCCSHHDQGCGDLRPGSDPRARGLEGPRQPKGPLRSRSSGVSGRAGREKKRKVKSPGACGERASQCLILSNRTVLVILLPPPPSSPSAWCQQGHTVACSLHTRLWAKYFAGTLPLTRFYPHY